MIQNLISSGHFTSMNILRWFFGGQPQWRDTETQTDPPVPAPNRSVTVYRLCKCGVVERAIVRCNDNMPMSEFCARAAITHEQCLLVRDPSAATVGECGIGRSVTVLESLGYAGPKIFVKLPTGHFRIVPFHENMEVVALYHYLQRR